MPKRSLLLLSIVSLIVFPVTPVVAQSVQGTMATLYVINTIADNGPGTLRQALLDAQNGDTIRFDTSVFPPASPAVIYIQSALPNLSQYQLTIDASDAGVILDGYNSPTGTNGLTLLGSDSFIMGLTIRNFPGNGISINSGAARNTIGGDRLLGAGPNGQGNLIIQNGATGIEISGTNADNNKISGNFIGIDASGWWAAGNGYSGVSIFGEARSNIIGGTSPGLRNVISGNHHNGIWIGGPGAEQNIVIGNYIGTRVDGMGPVGNLQSGISLPNGAQGNRIGGLTPGEGNLISGNADYGIFISDPNTIGNQVYGNLIGLNKYGNAAIPQGLHGIIIRNDAQNNAIGNAPFGRNIISGNSQDGIRIEGTYTTNNLIQGNYIGTTITGTLAVPNGVHGIDIVDGAHNNQIGMAGKGNVLSGNRNHGLVISYGAHHNMVMANRIGTDVSGSYSLGYQEFGGIDIAEGASYNVIGGLNAGEGNLISGNGMDGIALFSNVTQDTASNQVLGNRIGLALAADTPIPNQADGIFNVSRAFDTYIRGNTVAYNRKNGIVSIECGGSTISQNSIYSNTLEGIQADNCVPPPQLSAMSITTITGDTLPRARVEIFSDDARQGRVYQGSTLADASGTFTFTQAGGFTYPNVTATSTDANGDTSSFSRPVHLLWTLLLYLNGDNDLSEAMFDTLDNLATGDASRYANVLALVDGYTNTVGATTIYSGTMLYDLSYGEAVPISTVLSGTFSVPGELNLGNGQTLEAFTRWGREHYPASYTMLSIVDHGGGWAPDTTDIITGTNTLRRHVRHYLAGGSGLSWDFSSNYDYLDLQEVKHSLAEITDQGADPLEIVFFDVCLMGMAEVAYQIKDYAGYYISSQNIGWAPIGPDNRYIQLLSGIQVDSTPRQVASLLVQAYANSMPAEEHPYTVSAIDLAYMDQLRDAVTQLGTAISNTLTGPAQPSLLYNVYTATQKLDYDGDFSIEPNTDGFVDLYDFALQAKQRYGVPAIATAADDLLTVLVSTVVTEQHHSGSPWMAPEKIWTLDNTHGLSIFLPLGEDLLLPITKTVPITSSNVVTEYVHLLSTYTDNQLDFVKDTSWATLIHTYYEVANTPMPTDTTKGPASGLLTPDVAPPSGTITVTGILTAGNTISIQWTATDLKSGVGGAALWVRPTGKEWIDSGQFQMGSSGVFTFYLPTGCSTGIAVVASDHAKNKELPDSANNTIYLMVDYCSYLPTLFRGP